MIVLFNKINDLNSERAKVCYALGVLHSAYNAGELRQVDYEVVYCGYTLAIAKIDQKIFNIESSKTEALVI